MGRVLVTTPEDLYEAGHQTGHLSPCPFCGGRWPLTFTYHNPDTGIYRVEVHCQNDIRCGASIGRNERDAAGARVGAVAAWNRRATDPPVSPG